MSMTTPTPEEHARLCRTIAEHCGWYDIAFTAPERGSMTPRMTGRFKERMDRRLLPSYTTSLDAMAEAEATLSPFEWYGYTRELRRIVQEQCNRPECWQPDCERSQLIADFWFYCATALQRALAFVAVKTKTKTQ